MALDEQIVGISLKGGVDTKTDAKQVIAGKLITLENGTFVSPLEIKKRYGNTKLGAVSVGNGIGSYKDELLAFNSPSVNAYNSTKGTFNSKFSNFPGMELSTFRAAADSSNHAYCDSAYHSNGVQVFTWTTYDTYSGAGHSSSYYKVIDYTTKSILIPPTLIVAAEAGPKPIAIGNYVLVFYYNGGTLYFLPIDTTSPTSAPSPTTVSATLGNNYFDVCVLGTKVYVAWHKSGDGISMCTVSTALVVSAITTVGSDNVNRGISCFADSTLNQVWVAYCHQTGSFVKYFVRDSSLGSVLGVTSVTTGVAPNGVVGSCDNGSGYIFYQVFGGTGTEDLSLTYRATANNVGTVSTAVYLRSVGIASKPFRVTINGAVTTLITLVHQGYLFTQQTYFIANENKVVVAKIAPSNAGGIVGQATGLSNIAFPQVTSISNTLYQMSYLKSTAIVTNQSQPFYITGTNCAFLNFNSSNAYQSKQYAQNLHVTGGILWMYDGNNFVEHGYHLDPEPPTVALAGSGGFLSAGVYSVVTVAEWTDNQGQVHRSAPSIPRQFTAVNNDAATYTVPTIRLTNKSNVILKVYRTLVNSSIYFRVLVPQSTGNSVETNDTSVDSISIVDTYSDSAVAAQGTIYTNGGVIPNAASPAPSFVGTYRNRLLVLASEDKTAFQYSNEVVENTPVEFTDSQWNVDQKGGDLTCYIEMDEKLILFKNALAFWMTGEGPADTGASNDFSNPSQIPGEIGCSEPRSLALSPDGVMFKSLKGFYLLQRSLVPIYIGADVEAYNSYTVTSAQVIKDQNQVRFTLSSGDTLVYDYTVRDPNTGLGQWSVYKSVSAADSTFFQNKFTYINSAGNVYQETPGVFTDDGAFVKIKIVTSWLQFNGIQGFQRVRRMLILGDWKSAHTLTASFAYDYVSSVTQTTPIAVPTDPAPYQFRVHLTKQKCEAVQITLEESQTPTYGEGLSLSALAFEVGAKKGLYARSAATSFGT